jgi:hypothetical protein
MGRDSWSNRKTVEQCRCLDILQLTRKGCLRGYCKAQIEWRNNNGEVISSMGIEISINQKDSFEDHARLFYAAQNVNTGESRNLNYDVGLVSTPCHFGGVRYWFICPGIPGSGFCGKRVGKLYLPPGEVYFGCRDCYNLTYRSCKEHDSRLSALMKRPWELQRLLESEDPRLQLKGTSAWLKMLDKYR